MSDSETIGAVIDRVLKRLYQERTAVETMQLDVQSDVVGLERGCGPDGIHVFSWLSEYWLDPFSFLA